MAESSEKVSKPLFEHGKYGNPWPSWSGIPGLMGLIRWRREKDESNIPSDEKSLNEHLPIQTPTFHAQPPPDALSATWIGHATVVVQIDGVTVVTDPMWSERCSPLWIAGPKRYRPPPCAIKDLPQVDIAVISHNHYDHLDKSTVKQFNAQFGSGGLQWFVPVGLGAWMKSVGCAKVDELSWGEEGRVGEVRVVCLPAQHWSTRSLADRFRSLWSGWGIIGPKHRFFFAGDTGFCPEFERIGRIYGPFDLAAIPIGAYCPRWFMRSQHVDPQDAVKIHQGVKAKHSMAIHWGTFHMGSTEFYLAPKAELKEAVEAAGLSPLTDFFTLQHGQTWTNASQSLLSSTI